MGWVESLKKRASALRGETYALVLAYRDSRTPWYARAWAALVVMYAFSPIDLVPDFIPVLGYLDDLLLIPLGVGLAVRLIPAGVMADCRQQAAQALSQPHPKLWQGALIIAALWLAGLLLAGWLILRAVNPGP